MALAAHLAESNNNQQLSSNQLDLLKKSVEVLSPIKEITMSVHICRPCINFHCHTVHMRTDKITLKTTDYSVIPTMKAQLQYSLKSRFCEIEIIRSYLLPLFFTLNLKISSFQQYYLSNN